MNSFLISNPTKLAYSIQEFINATSLGRTKIYAEIKSGKLIAKKMSARTIITLEDGMSYLKSLPEMGTD